MSRKLPSIILSLLILAALVLSPSQVSAVKAEAPPPAHIVYNLYATDGFITQADGSIVYVYGFVGGREGQDFSYMTSSKAKVAPNTVVTVAGGPPAPTGGPIQPAERQFAGNAQFPAPIIYARTGDTVEIRLKNLGVTWKGAPNDPHSIHLHGLDVDAANDGVPETSVGAVPANMVTPGAGNVVVYMFSPTDPGTYMFHCHQEASIHVQMGMFGALVVYNPEDAAADTGPGKGQGGTLFGWHYDKDYVVLLSEFDLRQHKSEQGGFAAGAQAFNPVTYQPQYWQINGLSFPNTIHAGLPGFNFTAWEQSHPGYDPLITGSVSGGLSGTGEKVLVRMINMGFETQPMHMHGYHGKIIGSDQRAWTWANEAGVTETGEGMEKNTLTIGSGETYEWLIDFGQQQLSSDYEPGTQSRYNLTTNLPQSNTSEGDPAITWLGIPYNAGPTVVGIDGGNPAADNPVLGASQWFPFHNHEDYKATNNGVYPGGMFTMIVPTP